MATTMWGAVVSALVAEMRAVSGFRAPAATSITGTPVFDSVEVGLTEDHAPTWLVIGWTGDPDAPAAGGSGGQSVATLGTRARDETGTVRCRACAQTGDASLAGDTVPATRSAALVVVAAVEQALRTNPTLGLVTGGVQHLIAQMGGDAEFHARLDQGVVIEIDFTITYAARI